MKLPRFTLIEWLILIATLALLALCFTGCSSRGLLPGGGSQAVHGGPAGAIARIAVIVSSMAGIALILCGVALFFVPNKLWVAKIALAAFTALIAAGLLYWLAQYWAWAVGLSGVVLVAGFVGFLWVHRKDIEKRTGIDLDRDGVLG